MGDQERYLGGLSSSKLSKGVVGYGIYVTDKRIFGVRNPKAPWLDDGHDAHPRGGR